MPTVRPFRALRYDAARFDDLSAVLCPPYDVISAADQAALLARHPRNAVRLELPPDPRTDDPDGRYRAAARTLAEWRTDGTLRKDPRPALYVHEMRYRVTADDRERTALGAMLRLHLEPLAAGAGVRAHERTMSGPKEDRFKLLKATGTNMSPVVLLHERRDASSCLEVLALGEPVATAVEGDGTAHRLWVHPIEEEASDGDPAKMYLSTVAAGALTIADGHHRYETALRYQDERGQNRACESDPPYDYVLALLYAVGDAPAVLATHRIVRGIDGGRELLARAADLFTLDPVTHRDGLLSAMARPVATERGNARFGLWTRDGGTVLRARPERFEPLIDWTIPEPARSLDAALLAVALREIGGIDGSELVGGDRVTYTKDASEAIDRVDRGEADAAFILDPTPVEAVLRVADAGAVMPQKSTYFHPKAPTGLLFNPLEP
jgi:uncharacterized protein (DUF1015 family)